MNLVHIQYDGFAFIANIAGTVLSDPEIWRLDGKNDFLPYVIFQRKNTGVTGEIWTEWITNTEEKLFEINIPDHGPYECVREFVHF